MTCTTMTCTTVKAHRSAPGASPQPSNRKPGARRENRYAVLGRLLARAGELLFHYRYVRAELIERALERTEDDGGRQP